MHLISARYAGVGGGQFQRKAKLDRDLRPGELASALERARDGDSEAIRYLYLRFSGNVYGYVRSMLRDEHDAEDVTQQVFARVLPALAAYEQRGVPFSSWLLRIAHNTAIDHLRRRCTPVGDGAPLPCAEENRSRSLVQDLRDALEELPAPQREVVLLRHLAGLGPREIAQTLRCSEASVHGLHYRGRQALREALTRAGAAPMTLAPSAS
jgi:RNA polymerase sigma-70 factor (ECF subfamily)